MVGKGVTSLPALARSPNYFSHHLQLLLVFGSRNKNSRMWPLVTQPHDNYSLNFSGYSNSSKKKKMF